MLHQRRNMNTLVQHHFLQFCLETTSSSTPWKLGRQMGNWNLVGSLGHQICQRSRIMWTLRSYTYTSLWFLQYTTTFTVYCLTYCPNLRRYPITFRSWNPELKLKQNSGATVPCGGSESHLTNWGWNSCTICGQLEPRFNGSRLSFCLENDMGDVETSFQSGLGRFNLLWSKAWFNKPQRGQVFWSCFFPRKLQLLTFQSLFCDFLCKWWQTTF